MLKSKPIFLAIMALLIASLACGVPNLAPTPDSNAIGTMIVQTIFAKLSQTAQSSNSGVPTATFTATITPTQTLSPTPIFTTTPPVPQITVSVATNCRSGPGKAYDRVGALLVGQVAEVFGVDPTFSYWYIRNPDATPEFCWLWGKYGTLTGNIAALVVFTPPPTPTPAPAFDAAYNGKDTCVGWWVDIKLTNTGGVAFKSMSLTVRDTKTNVVVSVDANGFTFLNGCKTTNSKDTLNLGATVIVSSPAFAYDPSAHKLQATIKLCTGLAQSGTCISQSINFKP